MSLTLANALFFRGLFGKSALFCGLTIIFVFGWREAKILEFSLLYNDSFYIQNWHIFLILYILQTSCCDPTAGATNTCARLPVWDSGWATLSDHNESAKK